MEPHTNISSRSNLVERSSRPINTRLSDNVSIPFSRSTISAARELELEIDSAKDSIEQATYIIANIRNSTNNSGRCIPITSRNLRALDTIGELYNVLSKCLTGTEVRTALWRTNSRDLSIYLLGILPEFNINEDDMIASKQKYIDKLKDLQSTKSKNASNMSRQQIAEIWRSVKESSVITNKSVTSLMQKTLAARSKPVSIDLTVNTSSEIIEIQDNPTSTAPSTINTDNKKSRLNPMPMEVGLFNEAVINRRVRVMQSHASTETKVSAKAKAEDIAKALAEDMDGNIAPRRVASIGYSLPIIGEYTLPNQITDIEELQDIIDKYQYTERTALDQAKEDSNNLDEDIKETRKAHSDVLDIIANMQGEGDDCTLPVTYKNIRSLKMIKELSSTLTRSLSSRDISEAIKIKSSENLKDYLLGKKLTLLINKTGITTIKNRYERTIEVLGQAKNDHSIDSQSNIETIKDVLSKYIDEAIARGVDANDLRSQYQRKPKKRKSTEDEKNTDSTS